MGSIIGGLFSAGYNLDDLDSILTNASWDEFFSLEKTDRNELFVDQKITEDKAIFALRFDGLEPIIPTALNTGQKVSNFLNILAINAPLHTNSSFDDDLLYNFRAVSTDLLQGKQVVLGSGSLSKALRASSSVSFFLAPVKWDSLLLVDGGLVANIPVSIAQKQGCDYIIASNTTSPLRKIANLVYPWEIADQIVSIPMKIINRQQLDSADFVIEPDLKDVDNLDFTNIPNLIKRGYEAALNSIDQIKSGIKEKFLQELNMKEVVYPSLALDEHPNYWENKIFNELKREPRVTNKLLLYYLQELIVKEDLDDLDAGVIDKSNRQLLKIKYQTHPIINNISLDTLTLLNHSSVMEYLKPLIGRSYNSKTLLDSLLKIIRFYRKLGYSLASVDSLQFDKISGSLFIKISEGMVENIKVLGNDNTNTSIITREFPIKAGSYFSYKNAEQGLRNLTSINLFENIELKSEKKSNKNTVVIKLDEKIPRVLRFGLRIDNENLTQASIDLRDENLLGSGTEMGIILSGGVRNRSFIIEHRANRIFDTYLTYKIRAFRNFNDVNVYRDDSTGSDRKFSRSKISEYRQIFTGASLAIGAQIEKFGNIYFEWIFKEDEIKNKIDFPSQETYKSTLSSFKWGFSIDSQNKFPFPTNGFLINSYYETALNILGGNVSYTKFAFDYKSFFTLDEIHTFSPRFSIGFADKTLPLSQQFELGGHYSFFGLRDYEYRGRQIFLTSLEYRFKLPFKIFFDSYFKLRYDLGSIWKNQEEIRFKDLRHGIGATISLDSPIGRADFSVGRSFMLKKTLPENTISWGPIFFYFTIGYYY